MLQRPNRLHAAFDSIHASAPGISQLTLTTSLHTLHDICQVLFPNQGRANAIQCKMYLLVNFMQAACSFICRLLVDRDTLSFERNSDASSQLLNLFNLITGRLTLDLLLCQHTFGSARPQGTSKFWSMSSLATAPASSLLITKAGLQNQRCRKPKTLRCMYRAGLTGRRDSETRLSSSIFRHDRETFLSHIPGIRL